jgi:hypothetical protein
VPRRAHCRTTPFEGKSIHRIDFSSCSLWPIPFGGKSRVHPRFLSRLTVLKPDLDGLVFWEVGEVGAQRAREVV